MNDAIGCNLAHAAVQAIEIDRAGVIHHHGDGKGDLRLGSRTAVTGIAKYSSAREGRNGAIRRDLADAAAQHLRNIQIAGRTKSDADGDIEDRVERRPAIADRRRWGRHEFRYAASSDGRNDAGGRYHAHAAIAVIGDV